MKALLQAIMTKENTPAVGPTGNMVAGQNKACNGWFNELFWEAVINRSKKWAPTIEDAVMDKLRKKYYPNASLNDIRKSKTRRKKHRRELDGEEYELTQLPHTAWDPYLIVIQEGSPSSDEEQD